MKISLFISVTVLFAVLTGIAVFSEEPDHIPRPTEKELEEAVKKFGRKDGIPATKQMKFNHYIHDTLLYSRN